MKYKKWLDEWFLNYVEPCMKGKTRDCYAEVIENRIKKEFGEYEIDDISPIVIQHYVTKLLKNGNLITGDALSANTVNEIITVLQSSLKAAFSMGAASKYVGDKIRRPKIKEKTVTCFSKDEQRAIEKAVLSSKNTKYTGIFLCLYTGLRIGELLALTWDDVDLVDATVTVKKTFRNRYGKCNVKNDEKRVIDEPKSVSSKRVIPLGEKTVNLLIKAKAKRKTEFVVECRGGAPTVRGYQKIFEALLKKLNIERKGFHSLRHTFATRAIECGMDVKTLSEILGHKNASITLARYTHSLVEHKREMINKLDGLYDSVEE